MSREKYWIAFFMLLTIVAYFSFALFHLTKFITADEFLWINQRIPKYWDGIRNSKFDQTQINDKPGVTVALISGVGLHFSNYQTISTGYERNTTVSDPATTERLVYFFRLPIVIFTGLFSFFFFWIVRRITANNWIALWTFSFILLSPILLGMSQIPNPDSFLWIFSAAAIFSLYAYLDSSEKKFVMLCGIFFGLALLSKYTATILFPFFFFMIAVWLAFNWQRLKNDPQLAKKIIIDVSFAYFNIAALALLTFGLLMPAALLNKKILIDSTIGFHGMQYIFWTIIAILILSILEVTILKGAITKFFINLLAISLKYWKYLVFIFLIAIFLLSIINYRTGERIMNLDAFTIDTKSDSSFQANASLLQKLFIEFRIIVFSVTPVVLLLAFFAWLKSLRKTQHGFTLLTLSAFVIFYYLALIAQGVAATPRYSVMLYPIISFIAALGLWEIFRRWESKKYLKELVFLVIFSASVFSLWQIKPFYFDYTNNILPENYNFAEAWGFGGYEAAQYLNSLPNAENLSIWTDYWGVCDFFKGKCVALSYNIKEDKDYYVLTRKGKVNFDEMYRLRQAASPNHMNGMGGASQYYGSNNPVWGLAIDGRPDNYVKIYNTSTNP